MRARSRERAARRPAGFALLPIVLMLAVLAAIALVMSHEGAMRTRLAGGATEASAARYVAEAGLAHALWHAESSACAGDVALPDTAFGEHSYTATLVAGGASTVHALAADQDAWIRNDDPGRNNGTNADQHVRFELGNVEQALFRFDLSALPAGARVLSATLGIYVKDLGEHPEGPLSVHRVEADWTEAGVTWDSFAGDFDPAALATIPAQAQDETWVEVNLTGQVQAWLNGEPNHGILLDPSGEGNHGKYVSREGAAGQQPRLDVVIAGGDPAPATIQATGTLASGVSRTRSRAGVTPLQAGAQHFGPHGAPLDDTYVQDSGGGGGNGSVELVRVGDAGSVRHTLVRFDVSPIPVGARIRQARLALNLLSVHGAPAGASVTVHRMLEPWTEAGASWTRSDGSSWWTWPAAYAAATAIATTDFASAQPGWFEWDLAPLVQDWVDGRLPNDGLVLVGAGGLNNAVFHSGDAPDATDWPRLTIDYACACGSACLAPRGSGRVMMVVGNGSAPAAEDLAREALLEGWGYDVDFVDDGSSQAAIDVAVADHDVVYVSETATGAQVGAKLTDAAIGVVNEEGRINDDLGLETAESQNHSTGDTLQVIDASHYITRVFPAGPLVLYDAVMEGLSISGTPAPGLQALAAWGAQPSLGALEAGAELAGGGSAAARRVLLPFGDVDAVDWSRVNGDGLLLLQRSLAWAMGTGAAAETLGPIAHWKLDETSGTLAEDSVGGHDGKVTGGTWTSGQVDGGLRLSSFTQYVAVPPDPGLDLADEFTLAAWAFNADLEGYDIVLAKTADTVPPGGSQESYWLSTYGREISFGFHDGAWREFLTSGADLEARAWHHLAATFHDGDDAVRIYLDGAEVHRATTTASLVASDGELRIGMSAFNEPWTGILDDVRIYDRALDAGEIADLAAAGGGGGGGGPGPGGDCTGTFLDRFDAESYAGDDGTLSWTGPWLEINESDGPTNGDERVTNDESDFQLKVQDNDGGGEGVERELDLSPYLKAALRYAYRRDNFGDPDDYVTVSISANGGRSWTELARYAGPGEDTAYRTATFDISAHAGSNTKLRFLSSPDLGRGDRVWFDDVMVEVKGCAGP